MSAVHEIVIRWLGQACFLLSTLTGTHILLDPPHPQVGYHIAAHSIPANIVFVSHEHPDHNYVGAAKGTLREVKPLPKSMRYAEGEYVSPRPETLLYRRVLADHDNVHGAKRGLDTITVIETDGLRFCHLGDLGQFSLTPTQVREIGRVDVLMIPVGGFYTIDGTQAARIVGQLHPRVILPMHYRTPALNDDLQNKLASPTAFLTAMKGRARVVTVKARDLALSPQSLPRTPTIYLLRYQ